MCKMCNFWKQGKENLALQHIHQLLKPWRNSTANIQAIAFAFLLATGYACNNDAQGNHLKKCLIRLGQVGTITFLLFAN